MLSPMMLPIHCRILLTAPASLLTVHLRNLMVSGPLAVSSSFNLPPSSRRKKIPKRLLWKMPFCHCACVSQLTLKQMLSVGPRFIVERKKWGAAVIELVCVDVCNITHWGPSGWFSGQFVNCLPVLNDGWVAKLVLLCHDLLSVCVGSHSDVAEAILWLREQTHMVKDADSCALAHLVPLVWM